MLNSQSLAARLVPISESDRKSILGRLPDREGEHSQLPSSFAGAWYLHRGPLVLQEDYLNTLNVVVDGDLTIQGTLDDSTARGHLVVLGDLRCRNLLSQRLLVVTGSLFCGGLVYGDDHSFTFEVWGANLEARGLILTDKSARLPEERLVECFYDEDRGAAFEGDPEVLVASALCFLDEDGGELSEEDRRAGATVAQVRPAPFEKLRSMVRRHPDVFSRPFIFPGASVGRGTRLALLQADCPPAVVFAACADSALHVDVALSPAASPADLRGLLDSKDDRVPIALASHPATPAETLSALAKHKAAAVRAAVAHHPGLPEEHRAGLAKDRQANVRQQVSAGPFALPFLPRLTKDPSADVRRAVSSHPELSDDDRMLLLMDEDPGVRRRALRYLPETQEWVERLMQTDDADLIAWAVERRGGEGGAGALAEAADGLGDPRRAVREAWLRKVAAVPEMMRFLDRDASRFVTDDSPLVRRSLAICARDGGVLATLALDEVDSVREAALGNLGTPAAVLIEEAERLCAAPPERWGTTDPEYLFHIQAVEALLKHPRLPAAALSTIHRVFPLSYRLEPHRNMDAAVILERAMSLTPSLGLDARFLEWVEAAGAGTPSPTLWTTWLSCDDGYLRAAARLNPATPLEILLRQARRMSATELEGVALHPMLSFKTPAGASLLQLLMNQDDERVAVALASNPDAPLRVLREVAWKSATAKERAGLTAWQAHGELL